MPIYYSSSEWSHLRCVSRAAHRVVHHLHLDFLQDSLLFCEDFETHWHEVHKGEARAEPEELAGEGAHDADQLVPEVDHLVEFVVIVVLDELEIFGLLLGSKGRGLRSGVLTVGAYRRVLPCPWLQSVEGSY